MNGGKLMDGWTGDADCNQPRVKGRDGMVHFTVTKSDSALTGNFWGVSFHFLEELYQSKTWITVACGDAW